MPSMQHVRQRMHGAACLAALDTCKQGQHGLCKRGACQLHGLVQGLPDEAMHQCKVAISAQLYACVLHD